MLKPGESIHAPIGIFDTGLGGLTALKEIRTILPHERLIYFGDTGRVPYGSRSHEVICKYAAQDMRFLLSRAACKAIVIACGTVSANALPQLQDTFSVPFFGVIDPAAKRAAACTKNKKIGVIATASTIASGAYERALQQIDATLSICSRACPLFVPLVENGFIGTEDPIPRLTAERYLVDIRASGCDTLILGCTHYPILAPVIAQVLPNVTLIDSGYEVAHALRKQLEIDHLLAPPDTCGETSYFVSDEPHGFAAEAARFLKLAEDENFAVPNVCRINIEDF